jgi:hypothetical protein
LLFRRFLDEESLSPDRLPPESIWGIRAARSNATPRSLTHRSLAHRVNKPVSPHPLTTKDPANVVKSPMFASIDPLTSKRSRAVRRVPFSAGDNAQLTAMLTGITDSIKGLAGQKSSGMDPMMMMMMMMMMGGGGGGGAGPAAAAAPPMTPPPVINVSVKRNC